MSAKSIVAGLVTLSTILGGVAAAVSLLHVGGPGTPVPTSSPVVNLTPATTVSVTSAPPAPTSSASATPVSTAYPSSAQESFLATCGSYTGLTVSHCQCDLNWVEANYTYSPTMSAANELAEVEQAENNALCP